MNSSRDRLAALAALLLVVSAVLFAAGAIVEHASRSDHHESKAPASAGSSESAESNEAEGETADAGEATGAHQAKDERCREQDSHHDRSPSERDIATQKAGFESSTSEFGDR